MSRTVRAVAALSLAALSACEGPVVYQSPVDSGPAALDASAAMDAHDGADAPDTAVYCTGDVCCPATRPLACGAACVDPATDGDHCGGCDTACGAGGYCSAGACVCSVPQSYCPGLGCVDTTVDPAHCGACGTVCPAGATCTNGRCLLPCATGTHRCGDACAPDTALATCGALCTPCPSPARATAACTAGGCTFTCAPGFHACGLACVDSTALATCGDACAPCPTPLHGRAVCTPTGCGAVCDGGYHPCGTACASDASPASCGASCAPCPTPDHGAAACVSGVCAVTCSAGYFRCGGVCTDGNSPLGCGPGCAVCVAPVHATPTCAAGACGFACDGGYHLCGSACADDATAASCGSRCTPCAATAHATATCTAGACGFTCDRGYAAGGGACVELPRPIAPADLATVTGRRPSLRWNLPAGTGDAVVEVCRDRGCATVLATLPAAGGAGTPGVDLPRGTAFWRVRATATGVTSVVWQFTVEAGVGTVSAAWGAGTDVDGDGYADVAVGLPFLLVPGSLVYVYRGSAAGLRTTDRETVVAPDDGSQFAVVASSAGDVNGDGYGDLVVGAPMYMGSVGRAYVYLGSPTGLVTTAATVLTGPAAGSSFGSAVSAAGDVDGDGYGDLLVGASGAGAGGRVYLYPGSAAGTLGAAAVTLDGPDGRGGRFGIGVAAAGDVNADGYADALVGADGVGGYTGRAYVFLGSATGLATAPEATLVPGVGGQFGYAVAGVGDVDGDGYPDVAAGALTADLGGGRVYVYHGGSAGIDPTAIAVLTGPDGPGTQYGAHVAPAGDTDGDGYGDFTVGAPLAVGMAGRAYLYRGGATVATVAAETLRGPDTATGYFGAAVAPGRDVNGDGYADVVVSAERAAGYSGQVYVYPGGASGLGAPMVITGTEPGGRSGYSLAVRDGRWVCRSGG